MSHFLMQFWLHPAITHLAGRVDDLFYEILVITGIMFILVETLLVVFVIRYRRRSPDAYGQAIHGNTPLEIIWTLVPAIIFVWIGVNSVQLVYAIQTPPANTIHVEVIGHQWYWQFKYPNGVDISSNTGQIPHFPEDENVLFQITSVDVIHGFFVPRLRLQQDAVPGHLTQIWMNANQLGQFMIRCDQYCGVAHGEMFVPMEIDTPTAYQVWLNQQVNKSA